MKDVGLSRRLIYLHFMASADLADIYQSRSCLVVEEENHRERIHGIVHNLKTEAETRIRTMQEAKRLAAEL